MDLAVTPEAGASTSCAQPILAEIQNMAATARNEDTFLHMTGTLLPIRRARGPLYDVPQIAYGTPACGDRSNRPTARGRVGQERRRPRTKSEAAIDNNPARPISGSWLPVSGNVAGGASAA